MNYRRAVEIALQLSTADPASAQARRDLMEMYYETARVLLHLKNNSEAERYYRKALELAEALWSASPGAAQARLDLADVHVGLGRLMIDRGDVKEALEERQKALPLLEALVADAATNLDYRAALIRLYLELSRTNAAIGSNPRTPAASRIVAWQQAKSWDLKATDAYAVLRDRGALSGENAAFGDEIGVELRRCDEALAKLKIKN